MKPIAFDYRRPDSLDEACALLLEDDGARPIAGGQTLIPMLAMRLARPARLIDINRIEALKGFRPQPDGGLWIGACARQVEVERSAEIAELAPLLSKAIRWVGHPPTRARGTVGGSLANADPAAEIPLTALVCDAVIEMRVGGETEELGMDGYFIAPMVTAAPQGGLLTGARFPAPPSGRLGTAFLEVSARRSDFAFVSAAAQLTLDDAGRASHVRLGVGGVSDIPLLLEEVGEALQGSALSDDEIDAAMADAAAGIDCVEDLHVSAAYRRRGARALGARALREARDEALKRAAA